MCNTIRCPTIRGNGVFRAIIIPWFFPLNGPNILNLQVSGEVRVNITLQPNMELHAYMGIVELFLNAIIDLYENYMQTLQTYTVVLDFRGKLLIIEL